MRIRALAVLAALLAGCQVEGNASTMGTEEQAAPSARTLGERKPEPLAIPPEDPCLEKSRSREEAEQCDKAVSGIDPFIGNWKITRVHVNPEGVQAFLENDKAIVGSIFTVSATEMKWTNKASDKFTADDICKQPSATPLPSIGEKEEGSALTAALKPFAISASTRGPIHRFGCAGGGAWGPGDTGTAFIPVGKKQMLLKWYDGATLLAERNAP